jgi:hypothetical protein
MKKLNIGAIALGIGGIGIAYYLYNQRKKAKETTDKLNVEPANNIEEKETEQSEETPGSDGLVSKSEARQFVNEKLIPGATKLFQKAKQRITAKRKKRKSRVVIQPTESISKEQFEEPITDESRRSVTKRTRSERKLARTEKRTARKTARTEKRLTRRTKRKRNVSGFSDIPLLV